MQAAVLPASAGYLWAKQGWLLFRTQPLAFFSWAMFISLLLMTASITPPIGPIVFVTLMPCVTFMTMAACRQATTGQKLLLGSWFTPLKQKGLFKRFIAMGAIYVAICILLGLVAFVPFMSELSESVKAATTSNDLLPLLDAVRTPMIIFAVLYVLMASIFWYAPALVGFHGVTLTQSLFFSGIACWRNKWAFMLYGLVWLGVFLSIDIAMDLLTLFGLSDSAAATVQVPLNIAAGSVMYCSFYPNYVSVFESQPVIEAETPAEP